MKQRRHIRLLFNANRVYDQQVIRGVGKFLNATQCNWDIFVEDDLQVHEQNTQSWDDDGIIADLDNPQIEKLLTHVQRPKVGVGSSYTNPNDYPNMPYVATDNDLLVKEAFIHLKNKGLENFAFYGLPYNPYTRWANEREKAFLKYIQQDGFSAQIFRNHQTNNPSSHSDIELLSSWLQNLPQPVGIIGVTNDLAQRLLKLCEQLELMVPERIAIVGIDNEEAARYLTRTSLSSVEQGCQQMGYQAARLLYQQLEGSQVKLFPRLLVAPIGLHERQSSDFNTLNDPLVIQAMHYIRQHACQGVKVDQVLDHVGISRSNLESRFKAERGHSIHHELHHLRLQQACNLLRSTNLPLYQIATDCGYPSLQYMYAVFKKRLQKTPKDYRCLG